MKNLKSIHYIILIGVTGCLLFLPFLGAVHLFDWDEINFAECSREMLVLNDYTRVYVDFKPFWEKPPMFFWMQSTSMEWLGINEFAARFPNAVCGVATLIVLFLCGKKLFNKKFGLLWALAFAGSLFPNMYFKSGIIDPWFNLFIFLSLYFFILYYWKHKNFDKEGLKSSKTAYAIWSGIFMGLAILTKGQVALMIFLLLMGVYFLYNRFRFFFGWGHALLFLLFSFLVTLTWYGYETIKNGTWFIEEFLKYQYRLFSTHDAGQKGFFGYHYVVLLLGCFPASVLAIRSFFKNPYSTKYEKDFKMWMIMLFWVVTVLFSIVQSRIIHYSSMAWFPVTFLAAYTIYNLSQNRIPWKKYISVILAIIGGIISLALLAFPFFAMNIKKLIPYVRDKFAKGAMEADVHWSGWEALIGILFLVIVVAGLRWFKRKEYLWATWTLSGGTAIMIFLASAVIVPKIERYSQGAAIDFFELRQQEDCYVRVLGYKSYAQLFYTQKQKPVNENSYNQDWLLEGPIDKPVYFVTKTYKADLYKKYPGVEELYNKNGFTFLKREAPSKTE